MLKIFQPLLLLLEEENWIAGIWPFWRSLVTEATTSAPRANLAGHRKQRANFHGAATSLKNELGPTRTTRTELRIWTLDWFCEVEHLQSLPQHLYVSRHDVTFHTNVCLQACDEDGRVSHSATTFGLYSSALALSIRRASPNFCMKAPKAKVYTSFLGVTLATKIHDHFTLISCCCLSWLVHGLSWRNWL